MGETTETRRKAACLTIRHKIKKEEHVQKSKWILNVKGLILSLLCVSLCFCNGNGDGQQDADAADDMHQQDTADGIDIVDIPPDEIVEVVPDIPDIPQEEELPTEIDPITQACLNALFCYDAYGLGECVDVVDIVMKWGDTIDTTENSYLVNVLGFPSEYGGGIALVLALAENIDCVNAAGSDCDAVYACLNNGTVEDCSAWEEESRCEGNALRECMYVESEDRYVTDYFDCSDLSLQCVVADFMGFGMPFCGAEGTNTEMDAVVTCDGSIATIDYMEVILTFDCSILGGELPCREGTYETFGMIDLYCPASGPECDEDIFEDRCEGDNLITCWGGRELSADCTTGPFSHEDSRCVADEGEAACRYNDCPVVIAFETCSDGNLSFCGLTGLSEISCAEAGYSSCATYHGHARCE